MIVYQTKADGTLAGPVTLNDSDKCPVTGAWLIPGGCVEVAPPEVPDGKQCRFTDGAWALDNIPVEPEPVVTVIDARASKLAVLDQSAAAAYVAGFYSDASGTELYYDSDTETQTLLANIYQRTKETDWETKVRYPGIAPAGKAPIRARPLATDPDTAKTVQLLDAAQLKTLIDDLDAAFFAIKGKLWALQAQVEAAETVDAVNAISW